MSESLSSAEYRALLAAGLLKPAASKSAKGCVPVKADGRLDSALAAMREPPVPVPAPTAPVPAAWTAAAMPRIPPRAGTGISPPVAKSRHRCPSRAVWFALGSLGLAVWQILHALSTVR